MGAGIQDFAAGTKGSRGRPDFAGRDGRSQEALSGCRDPLIPTRTPWPSAAETLPGYNQCAGCHCQPDELCAQ